MSITEREALKRLTESSKRVVRRVPVRDEPLDELEAAREEERRASDGR